MTSGITGITSSHPIDFQYGEETNRAQITMKSEGFRLQSFVLFLHTLFCCSIQPNKLIDSQKQTKSDRDFELKIKLQNAHEPVSRVEVDSNGKVCAMTALYPDLTLKEDEDIYTEILFVIDRSGQYFFLSSASIVNLSFDVVQRQTGSMSGSRINQVKETMKIFIQSLQEGFVVIRFISFIDSLEHFSCIRMLFNLIGFGSNFKKLFDESREYDDKSLAEAQNYVNNLSANMGGTNILNPLMDIFKTKPKEGIPRQIFLLTFVILC